MHEMKRTLDVINERILKAAQKRQQNIIVGTANQLPRLVAVSKSKPTSSIIEAYECGQRHFGENYLQELIEKSNSPEIIERCPDLKFHLIGHLQSNKVNKLFHVRNLYMVETIDSKKLADLINKTLTKNKIGTSASSDIEGDNSTTASNFHLSQTNYIRDNLRVMIQVNTSGEENKSGIEPDKAPELAEHIKSECKHLELAGLMTIGKLDGWHQGPNMDFVRLHQIRNDVANRISINPKDLELSMGMSSDFEEAIMFGSTNVRIGSLIFGQR